MRIIKQKLRKREREQIPTYQQGEINCIDDENKWKNTKQRTIAWQPPKFKQ